VTYLRVRHSATLDRLQSQLHRALAATGIAIDQFHAPDLWVPHVTLAIHASEADRDAAARVLSGRTGLTARIAAIGTGVGPMLIS
jgi:2'-5' RNA ligase